MPRTPPIGIGAPESRWPRRHLEAEWNAMVTALLSSLV